MSQPSANACTLSTPDWPPKIGSIRQHGLLFAARQLVELEGPTTITQSSVFHPGVPNWHTLSLPVPQSLDWSGLSSDTFTR